MAKRKEWIECETAVTIGGRYEVSDGMVTAQCAHGEKCTQQGGLPADHVARLLLSEMARGLPGTDHDHRFTP
jgi:hypothetical protein